MILIYIYTHTHTYNDNQYTARKQIVMSAFSDNVFASAFARCFPLENDEGDAISRKQKERHAV